MRGIRPRAMTFDPRHDGRFRFGQWLLLVSAVVLYSSVVLAQDPNPLDTAPANADPQNAPNPGQSGGDPQQQPQQPERDPQTIFPHPETTRWWLSGQINIIPQGHGDFRALYSGPNSLNPKSEIRASRIFTLYTAYRLTNSMDAVFDLEEASGNGISNSLGVAGYPNIDVVRTPGQGSPLSAAPYVARAIFRYVLPLSDESDDTDIGPLGVLKSLPAKRMEFRIGKLSL